MHTRRLAICAIIASLLAMTGCATSPEDEQKRKDMEADIDEILSFELDPADFGEPKDCLADIEYRSYRALGTRHLLFEGRQDRQWVNVLRGRCPNLRDNSIFIMEPNMGGRLCDGDRFTVVDRIGTLSRARASGMCILGEFKPVTAAQVQEIENRLQMR